MPAVLTPEQGTTLTTLSTCFTRLGLDRKTASTVSRKILAVTAVPGPRFQRKLPDAASKYIQISEAAKQLGVDRATAYRWVESGHLVRPIDKRTGQPKKVNGLAVVTRASFELCLKELNS